MSSGEKRHFLIVPSSIIERRHSWGNAVSADNTNMESHRWEDIRTFI